MFKFSKPVILQQEKSHQQRTKIGPEKKRVSLQTQDTAQATDAGQNEGPGAGGWVLIVLVVVVVCGAGAAAVYYAKKKGLSGGGTVANRATGGFGLPSIIDEEVSSILTNLSQL